VPTWGPTAAAVDGTDYLGTWEGGDPAIAGNIGGSYIIGGLSFLYDGPTIKKADTILHMYLHGTPDSNTTVKVAVRVQKNTWAVWSGSNEPNAAAWADARASIETAWVYQEDCFGPGETREIDLAADLAIAIDSDAGDQLESGDYINICLWSDEDTSGDYMRFNSVAAETLTIEWTTAFERFENEHDQSWTLTGSPTHSFVAGGSHGDSAYCERMTGLSSEYYAIQPAAVSDVAYLAGWFKISTDGLADGNYIYPVGIYNPSGYNCSALYVTKTGTQLTVNLEYYDNGDVTGTAQNIAANTWYHFGIKYDTTGATYAWYLSTDEDLGAAIDSGSLAGSTREPDYLRFGNAYSSPYNPGTTIDFDSFDLSISSLVHDAEDTSTTAEAPFGLDAFLREWFIAGGVPAPFSLDAFLGETLAPYVEVGGDHDISGVGAIASAEAFGTLSASVNVAGAGAIASAEAVGTPSVAATIAGAGAIVSAGAFGTLGVSVSIAGVGAIVSAGAFGTPGVAATIAGVGAIASGESVGTPGVSVAITSVGGIASGEAFGEPTVTVVGGDWYVSGVGAIASAEAFGNPTLTVNVAAVGNVTSAEAFGSPSVAVSITGAGAIAGAEAFGSPSVAASITGAGAIASAGAVGTPGVGVVVSGVGAIASGEVFGVPDLSASIAVVGGIASAEAFGEPIVFTGTAPLQTEAVVLWWSRFERKRLVASPFEVVTLRDMLTEVETLEWDEREPVVLRVRQTEVTP
jgi:hypothetical protein